MKTLWIILLSASVGALLSGMLMRSCQTPQVERVEIVKTDTLIVERVDTIEVIKPMPYKVTVKDTVYVNSFQNDTDWKVLVQEVKEYKDSTYYAKISGINAYLEEIQVYPKTTTVYINTTEAIYVQPKKWDVGIQAGVGITPKGLQPYIGVGVTYRLDLKPIIKFRKRAK